MATSLQLAAEDALWLSRYYIGTEHLLLGITQADSGSAPALLRRLGASPEQLHQQLQAALNDGATEFDLQTAKQIAQLSELSRRVINAAEQRALSMHHETVGLGHLLLELALESRSPTAQMLRDCGLDERRLQQDLSQASPALLMAIEAMLAQVIDLAGDVGSHYIGTEHLLRVLVRDPAGSAALRTYGVDPALLLHRLDLK
jgi:ATP-dependent Clp protease ATP-binding subunit ClpC